MLKGGTRLSDLRVDNDLKQNDIAKFMNIPRSTYANWEVGSTDFSLDDANKLANFYKVNMDYLLGMSNIISVTNNNSISFKTLTSRLLLLRKEKKITQYQLSNQVGFALSTYACYEKGIRIPTTFKLLYIAKFYNVSMDYLVGRSDIKEIKNRK